MIGIMAGVAAVSMVDHASDKSNHIWAVCALVLETILSGFASAWTQMSFGSNITTMWVRNVQLSFLSCLMYASTGIIMECSLVPTEAGMMFGVLSAVGGILVALTILHVGAIEKTVTTNFSTALTVLVEGYLFGNTMDFRRIMACICVFVDCWIFSRIPIQSDNF